MRCSDKMIITEVLRLHEQFNYSLRKIEDSSMCSKTTAAKIIKRCVELGLDYETAKTFSDEELKKLVFNEPVGRPSKTLPDFEKIHQKITTTKKNLQYLWEECVANQETDASYSRFCFYYRKYKFTQGIGVHSTIERTPGEKMYIDWVGDTLNCIINRNTGELTKAYFFITTLGDSSYPYCEAFPNMNQLSWNTAHVNAFTWYGAIPKILVPDNCRTAISRASMWDPKINRAYLELAQYYRVSIEPARIRRPKDKSTVETGVRWLETWLLEWLRDYGPFTSFPELNKAIRERMIELSDRKYTSKTRKDESRRSMFENEICQK